MLCVIPYIISAQPTAEVFVFCGHTFRDFNLETDVIVQLCVV